MKWLLAVAACVVACADADRGGSSLRGALEALQRRQRGRGPILPQPDYDAFYEFVPPRVYPEPDYPVDVEDFDDEPNSKYLVKLIDQDPRPVESYEYKLYKKSNNANSVDKKESAFRERSHHPDNERLRDLFMDKNEVEDQKTLEDGLENDADYALLLGQLWSKYKYNKEHGNNVDSSQQGVVKLYKEKVVKKRYSDNWGPIAFKRKRSSNSNTDRPVMFDYDARKSGIGTAGSNYNSYDFSDDGKDDLREEYSIAFQPLDDDNISNLADDEQYTYDAVEKRFPVTKRSSGPYMLGVQKKRFVQSQNKREVSKKFRSSAGTDPKIIRDLSEIFGGSENDVIKSLVKRSSNDEEHEHGHEVKPPMITPTHNNTHEHNNSSNEDDDNSHEHHGLNIHHPSISSKDADHEHINTHENQHDHEKDKDKPINIRKKSIDWSDYFGIDKRSKQPVKFVNDLTQGRLRKQYFDTFTKEVLQPFHIRNNVKRNYVKVPNEETQNQMDRAHLAVQKEEKKSSTTDNDSKLDNIDKKLRSMEGMIVDEALHYSNVDEELDSKEEQEMKEKLLSRLAAAYSLEKMRKALKEFRHSLQIQKTKNNIVPSPNPTDDSKAKRVAIKKEKVDMMSNEMVGSARDGERNNDFEEEQGAGHYLNGKTEEHLSEGYMGGSGRHRTPVMSTVGASGSCPVLGKIVQRCRSVDLLAGDRGQLFLPLCSLHQICYLCGEAPPTTCDLVFLSEADTTCERDMSCQRAARSALMALRELHDNLADELDGECEASPCLPATLKLNLGWQRAFQR